MRSLSLGCTARIVISPTARSASARLITADPSVHASLASEIELHSQAVVRDVGVVELTEWSRTVESFQQHGESSAVGSWRPVFEPHLGAYAAVPGRFLQGAKVDSAD